MNIAVYCAHSHGSLSLHQMRLRSSVQSPFEFQWSRRSFNRSQTDLLQHGHPRRSDSSSGIDGPMLTRTVTVIAHLRVHLHGRLRVTEVPTGNRAPTRIGKKNRGIGICVVPCGSRYCAQYPAGVTRTLCTPAGGRAAAPWRLGRARCQLEVLSQLPWVPRNADSGLPLYTPTFPI